MPKYKQKRESNNLKKLMTWVGQPDYMKQNFSKVVSQRNNRRHFNH